MSSRQSRLHDTLSWEKEGRALRLIYKAREMVQLIKALVANPDDLGLILKTS